MTDQATNIVPTEPNYDPNSDNYHRPPDAKFLTEAPKPDWSHPAMQPFAKVFGNIADTVVRASQLSAQVEALQHTVDTLQATLQDLMQERSHLRADLRDTKAENQALRDQVAQQQASLDNERAKVVDLQAKLDTLNQAHAELNDAFDHAEDDRDLANLERDDWKEKHQRVSTDFETLTNDLASARAQWFSREDTLQREVRDLTAERNSYRDKFDACKSFAAKVMAMDQVKPQPVEVGEAVH